MQDPRATGSRPSRPLPQRDTAWAMSEENVERVRRAFEEFNRTRKPDLGGLDPDIVWHTPADIPEHATLEGREAVDRHLSGYAESFDDFNTTVEELTQVGDCVVVAIRLMGRIKGTDDWLDLPGAQVWEFNALGRATRVREFRSVTEALEAAGLSE
jgi:ketosteroid isomerase-like protein